ncbi:hypothetical protein DdX_07683 [Ditylenchus destructor]|uniref:Uncharacterized protein n=1 Tax=Ditylenchus destructor TaxID=166010 RepID=A0AAD4R7R6_9BILA|nr:hypothetical protein DdX_07683 [Ditylenchus destructor]
MVFETEYTDRKLVICEDDEEVEVLVKLISNEGNGIPVEDVLTVSKHLSVEEFSEQINRTFGLNIEHQDLLIRKFHHKFNTCVTVKTDSSTFLEDAAIFEVSQLPKQEDLKRNIKLETNKQLADKLQETSQPSHSLPPIKQEFVSDGFCNSSVTQGGSIQNDVLIKPTNVNSEESRPVFSQIESNCVYKWDEMPSKGIRDVYDASRREFHAENVISPEVRRKPNVLFHSSGKRKSLGHADAKYFKCAVIARKLCDAIAARDLDTCCEIVPLETTFTDCKQLDPNIPIISLAHVRHCQCKSMKTAEGTNGALIAAADDIRF